MKLQNLHTFSPEDWKKLESQFAGFAVPTIEFVTENKGSLAEAESIYAEAFVYYTQLIELRGPKIMERAEQIIYSFSRKLWIHKLEKRNVDLDFVSYRRAFFEMEGAFHEIDSINNRSEKTAEKLADIGEPARTLILEHIGHGKELCDVVSRLGFSDEDRAYMRIAKSLRKLIKDSDAKDFDISDAEFEKLVRFVLDNNTGESVELPESEKVGVAIISRSIAMVRSYVTRKARLRRLKEMQERIEPETHSAIEKSPTTSEIKHRKMKPLAILALSAIVALTVSAITAFSLSGMVDKQTKKIDVPEVRVDSAQTASAEPQEVALAEVNATAFAIHSSGLFITSADLAIGDSLTLSNAGSKIDAAVVFRDPSRDIAILKSNTSLERRLPFRFSPKNAQIGQDLFVVGFPENEYYFSKGTLNTLSEKGIGELSFQKASAGSPVIADHGQVTGIVLRSGVDAKASTLCVSEVKKSISEWAREAEINLDLTNRNGLFYSDISEQVEKLAPFVYKVENRMK